MEISFRMFAVNHCDAMQVDFKPSITENILCNYLQCVTMYMTYIGLTFEDIMTISVLFHGERSPSLFEEGFGLQMYLVDA